MTTEIGSAMLTTGPGALSGILLWTFCMFSLLCVGKRRMSAGGNKGAKPKRVRHAKQRA